MGRRRYSAEDKAQALVLLRANDFNVRQASMDLGIPEQTVRDWKKSWDREAPSDEIEAQAEVETDKFVTQAVAVRDVALRRLSEKLDNDEVQPRDLNAIIGTLTDKIRLAKGQATARTETIQQGPSPREIGAALVDLVQGAVEAAHDRSADIHEIIEVEQVEELDALPAPSDTPQKEEYLV